MRFEQPSDANIASKIKGALRMTHHPQHATGSIARRRRNLTPFLVYGPVTIEPLIPTAKTCPPGCGAAQIP